MSVVNYHLLYSGDQEITSETLVVIADSEGRNIYADRRAKSYFGVTDNKILGHNWVLLIHPDDQETAAKNWIRAVNSCKEYNGVYRYKKRDNTYHWFKVRGTLTHSDNPEKSHWIIISTPFAEHERNDQEGITG